VADEFEQIAVLIEAGRFDAAREALRAPPTVAGAAVLRVALGLAEGGLSVSAAMQRLVQIMREDPDTRGARALYQKASGNSYRARESSPSHSHPRLMAVRLPGDDKR
jgi:hypothetical protein